MEALQSVLTENGNREVECAITVETEWRACVGVWTAAWAYTEYVVHGTINVLCRFGTSAAIRRYTSDCCICFQVKSPNETAAQLSV